MKAKLIKDHQEYMLINDERFVIATTDASMLEVTDKMKLSKQNCDKIFGVVDVEKLAHETLFEFGKKPIKSNINDIKFGIKVGLEKAMELNKDKVFTLEDMRKAMEWSKVMSIHSHISDHDMDDYIQSLQQPTEIEVTFDPEEKDSEGCLILKKI